MNTMLDRLLLPEEELTVFYNSVNYSEDELLKSQLRHAVLELDKAGMLYHKCCELVGGKPGAYTSDDCPACKLIRELKEAAP